MRYPAKFILIAAANPCPCGYAGSAKRPCTCLPGNVQRYQKKISGPIMDRIDLHIAVPEVPITKLARHQLAESSAFIRDRVQRARDMQSLRYRDSEIICNAELTSKQIKKYCQLEPGAQSLLLTAASTMNLSARVYQKVVKISQTIADLAAATSITADHVAEALQYRPSQFVS